MGGEFTYNGINRNGFDHHSHEPDRGRRYAIRTPKAPVSWAMLLVRPLAASWEKLKTWSSSVAV